VSAGTARHINTTHPRSTQQKTGTIGRNQDYWQKQTQFEKTHTISCRQGHIMSHEDANSGRTQSLFERLIQSNDPLLGQIDRNAKSLLQSALGKLDVVSREEFDAQTAVLQRTRQRLETLEQQIEALSNALERPTEP